MSFIKNFIKKINKLFKKNSTPDEYFGWDNDICSSYSAGNKKNSWSLLLSTEEEEQLFKKIEITEYKIFTNYEQFKEHLIKNKIINCSLRNYENIKSPRIQHILGACEAHMRSYFYLFRDPYFSINNTLDLREERAIGYEQNFESWFYKINLECEQFNIKYFWSYNDVEEYTKENLLY